MLYQREQLPVSLLLLIILSAEVFDMCLCVFTWVWALQYQPLEVFCMKMTSVMMLINSLSKRIISENTYGRYIYAANLS